MFAIRDRETWLKEGKKQDNSKKQLIDWQRDYVTCWALNNIDEFDFELQARSSIWAHHSTISEKCQQSLYWLLAPWCLWSCSPMVIVTLES